VVATLVVVVVALGQRLLEPVVPVAVEMVAAQVQKDLTQQLILVLAVVVDQTSNQVAATVALVLLSFAIQFKEIL
jgi:hypothetical protein